MERRSTAKPLVIFVDDEPLLLRACRRLLAGLPVRVRCCESAAAALEAVAEDPPAVIVSDHHMPHMTGLELLARIRREHPGIDAVLYTTDADALKRAARLGARGMDKGGDPDDLLKLVESLIEARPGPSRP